ncbi:hypothetical protein [Patulibacter sp. SYSU D01012]|uniref:hypothetical protein n=1 Tax=Patulibacter sp. SYSU D01012 TaxID=2817381 RepID=UPI001B3142F0|nr:hypothetical protein [Patulibacter sp. SYSU D01012]
MATQTAQILIKIRGALRAANETARLSRSVDELGDELGEASRKGLQAAASIALFGTAIGGITLAAPALMSVLSAMTVAALAFGTALGGIAVAAGAMAFAATQRFKQTVGVAGSAAAQLQTQARSLQTAFFSATAGGADAVLGGLVPLLAGVEGLVTRLQPSFTAVGKAIGDAFTWLGGSIGELAPELAALLQSTTGAFQPIAQIGLTLVSIFARVATIAMPYVIDALNGLLPLLGQIQGAITGGAIQSAFSLLGTVLGGIRTLVGSIADVLGPVLVPAAQSVGAAFSGIAGPAGTMIGSLLAGAVQLASGVLPLLADAIRGIAPVLQSIVASGALTSIGQGIATGIRAAVGYVRQFIGALMPMRPFVTNVLLPFAKGIAVGLIGALRSAIPVVRLIATAIGWVGTKLAPLRGTFQAVGTIIGTLFAGAILKAVGIGMRIGGLVARIIGWLGSLGGPVTTIVGLFVGGFNEIRSGVSGAINWVRDRFNGLLTFLGGIGGKIGGFFTDIWGGLKSGLVETLNWIIDKINVLIRGYNKLPLAPDIGEISRIGGGGDDGPLYTNGLGATSNRAPNAGSAHGAPRGLAMGGPILGGAPYRDRIPALLMPGEHVLTRREVQAAGGHGAIYSLRAALAGDVPRFANGGPVGSSGGGSLAGSLTMPPIDFTAVLKVGEREIGLAVERFQARQQAREGAV